MVPNSLTKVIQKKRSKKKGVIINIYSKLMQPVPIHYRLHQIWTNVDNKLKSWSEVPCRKLFKNSCQKGCYNYSEFIVNQISVNRVLDYFHQIWTNVDIKLKSWSEIPWRKWFKNSCQKRVLQLFRVHCKSDECEASFRLLKIKLSLHLTSYYCIPDIS